MTTIFGPKTMKVLKGTLIAGAGAVLAYLAGHVADLDLGTYGPALAAVAAVAINAARQALSSVNS